MEVRVEVQLISLSAVSSRDGFSVLNESAGLEAQREARRRRIKMATGQYAFSGLCSILNSDNRSDDALMVHIGSRRGRAREDEMDS